MNSIDGAYVGLLLVAGLPFIIASARKRSRAFDDVRRIRTIVEGETRAEGGSSAQDAANAAVERLEKQYKR